MLDTGRLHPGAARIFVTTTLTVDTDDCSTDYPIATGMSEADYDGGVRLDNGRLCYDVQDNSMYVVTGVTAADPPTGGTWTQMFNPDDYIASGMIVLKADRIVSAPALPFPGAACIGGHVLLHVALGARRCPDARN